MKKENHIKVLEFWTRHKIPYVWDETLSLYQLVRKTIQYLNKVIEDQNELKDIIKEFIQAFEEDLQDTVIKVLEQWKDDGSLKEIINEALFESKLDKVEFEEYKEQNKDKYTIIRPSMSHAEIQNLIDSSSVKMFLWLDGVYYLSPLFVKSNQTHIFRSNVTIKGARTFKDGERLFNVYDVENVNLYFNGATLMLNNEKPNQHGGNMHCLTVNGSRNITIKDVTLKDSGGDGLYIGHKQDNDPSENITVENIKCLNNKRQGISITDVKGCFIRNVLIDGVHGGDPASGIDIEPNNPEDFIENIIIENVVIKNTDNAGILIALPYLASNPNSLYPDKYNEVSITLKDIYIENTRMGIHFYHLYNRIGGFIDIENIHIKNTKKQGIVFDGWYKNEIPELLLKNITIDNVNQENKNQAYDGSGIVMQNELTKKDKDIGGFVFDNLKIIESREDKRMRYTIFGQNFKDGNNCFITLQNSKRLDSGVLGDVLLKGGVSYINSKNPIEQVVNITKQIEFNYKLPEKIVKNSGDSISYLLNGGLIGNKITFVNNTDSVLKIRAMDGYTLDNLKNEPGVVVESYQSNIKGSEITIELINSDTFAVVGKKGVWNVV